MGCPVLFFADLIKVVQSPESHSVCTPRRACQLLHRDTLCLGSGFSFITLLFPCQPFVESHTHSSKVIPRQNLTFDMQSDLFFCWKAEDSIGVLPGVDFDKQPFCPTFLEVQCLLQSVVYSCRVLLWAPQDQKVGLYGSRNFTRQVSDDVIDENKKWCGAQGASLWDSSQCLLAVVGSFHMDSTCPICQVLGDPLVHNPVTQLFCSFRRYPSFQTLPYAFLMLKYAVYLETHPRPSGQYRSLGLQ